MSEECVQTVSSAAGVADCVQSMGEEEELRNADQAAEIGPVENEEVYGVELDTVQR